MTPQQEHADRMADALAEAVERSRAILERAIECTELEHRLAAQQQLVGTLESSAPPTPNGNTVGNASVL